MNNKIQVSCDDCGKRLAVPATAAGKKIRCPACEGVIRVPSMDKKTPPKKKKPQRPRQEAEASSDASGDDPYAASPSASLPPRTKKKKSKGAKGKPASEKSSGKKKLQLGVSMFFGSMMMSAGRMAVFGNKTPVTNEEKGAAFGAALVIFLGVVSGLVLMLWGSIQNRKEKRD